MADHIEEVRRFLPEYFQNRNVAYAHAHLDALKRELADLRAECRYEIEPGHFIRCPENHGSNGSLYDRLSAAEEFVEAARDHCLSREHLLECGGECRWSIALKHYDGADGPILGR